MTREETIQLRKKHLIEKSILFEEADRVIREYCIEMGKTENIEIFINAIKGNSLYGYSLDNALTYYEKKFNVIKIHRISENEFTLLSIF